VRPPTHQCSLTFPSLEEAIVAIVDEHQDPTSLTFRPCLANVRETRIANRYHTCRFHWECMVNDIKVVTFSVVHKSVVIKNVLYLHTFITVALLQNG
jgi:hypothetical protein